MTVEAPALAVEGGRSADAATRSDAPYLRIQGLGKRFGGFVALADLSFDVSEGEFVCVIGPSGCGKTTLLRIIAGLDTQSEGRLEQGGREISSLPTERRDFGIVFQSYALFPNLTVFDNVAYGLVRWRKADIKKRVDELLDMVRLSSERDKYPAQLSGGQQQRIAVIRALANSPGLLLLDEPLSALDARVRLDLRHRLRELQRRLGVTTVMVTHDQSEALTIADRIVVINRGRIEQIGAPLEVYQRPATPFVADFLGTTNFLDAVVVGKDRVALADGPLACDTGDLASRTLVSVSLRPEHVGVRGVHSSDANTFQVRIDQLEFNGSFFRARLSGGMVANAVFFADFSANAVNDLELALGNNLLITLPPKYLRVFPRS